MEIRPPRRLTAAPARFVRRASSSIALFVFLAALPSSAAVIAVSSIDTVDGVTPNDRLLAGITIGSTSYTSWTAPTTVNMLAGATYFWGKNGTSPGGNVSAVTNNIISDGALNIGNSGLLPLFDFGRPIVSSDVFVFFDVGTTGADAITLRPVDSSGTFIDSYSLSISAGAWSPALLGPFDASRSGGAADFSISIYGISFTAADFTGGAGGLDAMVGFRVTTGRDFVDAAGVYVTNAVPEPSSPALLFAGAFYALAARRALVRHRRPAMAS